MGRAVAFIVWLSARKFSISKEASGSLSDPLPEGEESGEGVGSRNLERALAFGPIWTK